MRFDKRDIFRDAALLCRIFFCAARASNGWAIRYAAWAAVLSPASQAASTLRTQVRIAERRSLFTKVRFAILRTIFFADFVFAIILNLRLYLLR